MNLRILLVATLVGTIASLLSCADDSTLEIDVGGNTFTVEIAATPDDRQRGLMYRDTLGEDQGMLFVFPREEMRSFWMKNTSIPLSIAYIDAGGVIREIYDMEPYSLAPVPSRFPAMYALEVRQGRFTELGIEPGDRVTIPDIESD